VSAPDCDVLVIGGGIHGVGVAQAAAAAGHSVLLLEARALAAGTSSRSSKLIHGGLRYLETFQLGLVRESLAERALLLRNAPELVRLVPFHIPVYRDTSRRPLVIRAGLSLYALLGGLGSEAQFEHVPPERWGELDGLRTDGLRAVFRYYDGQTDDAKLTRAVMDSARALGAELACPARLVAAERAGLAWQARFEREGKEERVRAAVLVNAAGPWIEEVRRSLRPAPPSPAIELVQGAHVELGGRLARGVYYAEAPRDRRAVFVMPWHGHTLVGTTETSYRGDPADTRPLEDEVGYLIETFRRYFPDRPVEQLDAWSGLRVLPAGRGAAFARPRDVRLLCDDRERPRVVTILGGKLTGYRATAEKVVRLLARTLPPSERRADTRFLRLVEPEQQEAQDAEAAAAS
jgi:glycerol-3-phosphate dehydrogenase